MSPELLMGDLLKEAKDKGISGAEEMEYSELREELDIKECKHCGKEYLNGCFDPHCSDACECEYISEHF